MLEVIAFCERQEAAEEHEKADDKKVVSHKSKSNDTSSTKKQKVDSSGKKDRNCLFHGPGTHPSSSCKVLQAMVDSTKKSRETTTTNKGNTSGKQVNFKSNTWNRKAEEAKAATKKELNAYVKKIIDKQLKKASVKKRPQKDGDDDKSLNALDQVIEIKEPESEDETGLGNLTLSSDSDSDASE